jgi:hypothetical protein
VGAGRLGRRVLVLLVAAVMAVMLSIGPALAHGGGSKGHHDGGNKKVTICHKGKNTLHIPKHAAKKHLKKHDRDYWGPCKKKSKHW